MRIRKLVAVTITVAVIAAGAFVLMPSEREVVDGRFSGAYRLADGSLVTITPSTPTRLRMRHLDDGQVHSLYYDETNSFDAAAGFSSRETVAYGQFRFSDAGVVTGATWEENGTRSQIQRIGLPSDDVEFMSGELRMRGRLILPEGEGPFPVVIMIHGSEDYSAVDYYHLPYLLAAKGIAGFAFDKRGTGGSDGEYTQHFPTLAGDVVAAAELLKSRSDIDPSRVHLAGFSQGGWIAPLVAQQTDIRSILVGFGCAVSVRREDRWGYVKRLQDRGFGTSEVALADAMNGELDTILDSGDDAAWDRLFTLLDTHSDEDWFHAVSGSDSLLGIVIEKSTGSGAFLVPEVAWKMYFDWKRGDGPDFNRTYEPRVTLSALDTPSLWLLAGEDTSAPTYETTAVLDELSALGKPVEYRVYADAEHGNVLFEEDDTGERTYSRYADSYLTDIVDWVVLQSRSTGSSTGSGSDGTPRAIAKCCGGPDRPDLNTAARTLP